MKFPESRTFRPDYGIKGPSRRARNWSHFKLAAAVIGGLIIARLVLRALFPGVFL